MDRLGEDFRLIYYDQRGAGSSGPIDTEDMTFIPHLEDLDGRRESLGWSVPASWATPSSPRRDAVRSRPPGPDVLPGAGQHRPTVPA
ncbi:MAG TPA: hypothetical protein VHF25_13265 [Nitriliruptorales bacterium]|nr:hypothetical protein [Nitriliruptorales bacterium]